MKAFDNVLNRLIDAEWRLGVITNERDDAKLALRNAVLARETISEKLAGVTRSFDRLHGIEGAAGALYDAAEEIVREGYGKTAKSKLMAAMKALDPLLDRIPF